MDYKSNMQNFQQILKKGLAKKSLVDSELKLQRGSDQSLRNFYKQICHKQKSRVNADFLNKIDDDKEKIEIQINQLNNHEINQIVLLIKFGAPKQIVIRSHFKQQNNQRLKQTCSQSYSKLISETISNLRNMNLLKLKNIPVLDIQILELQSQLKQNSHNLKELGLVNIKLTEKQFQYLMDGLLQNQSISLLDLSNNQLNDQQGIQLLKQLISRNCTVNVINQHQQQREEVDSVDFGRSMFNLGIHEYNLAGNLLTDSFLSSVSSVLKKDKTVRSINLSKNKITNEGLGILVDILEYNQMIISMDLRKNHINEKDNPDLKKVLEKLIQNLQLKKVNQQTETMRLQELVQLACDDKIEHKQNNHLQNRTIGDLYDVIIKQYNIIDDYNNYSLNIFQQINQQIKNQNLQENQAHEQNISDSLQTSLQKEQVKCRYCLKLKQELLKTEAKYFKVKLENTKLKNLLMNNYQKDNNNAQMINHSLSAINIENVYVNNVNTNVNNNMNNENKNNTIIEENQNELLNKIEYFMLELTRMMDNMENMSSNTNNFTCNMTNSNSQNNNLTQKLINSDKQINLNHVLQQHNTSNILQNNNQNNVSNQHHSNTFNLNQQNSNTFINNLNQQNSNTFINNLNQQNSNTFINNLNQQNSNTFINNLNQTIFKKGNLKNNTINNISSNNDEPCKKVSFNQDQQNMIINQTFNQKISVINSANTSKEMSSLIGNIFGEKKNEDTNFNY